MASAKFELILSRCNSQHMDIARGVFVQRHRFKKNELAVFTWILDVDQLEEVVVALENVGVTLLADLALELFPVVARYIFTIFFHVPLRLYPIF